jgi:hypothetical protein
MDAETRKRCADALRGATVETLREDALVHAKCADTLEGMYREDGDPIPPGMVSQIVQHRRTAALYLAVAALTENGVESVDWGTQMTPATSALAALIEGET